MNNIPAVTKTATSPSNAEPYSPTVAPELTVVMIYALTLFAGIALYYAALRLRTPRLSQITPQTRESLRGDVERRLNEWVQRGAKTEIIQFLNNDNSTHLSLWHLESTTFPRIWSSPLFSRLQQLNINPMYLSELPEDLCDLTSLRELSFWSERITTLPTQISKLTNLELLAITGGSIQAIPPQIGNLTNLRTLRLEGSELSSLPDEISNLTNLRSLSLLSVRSLPPQVTLLTNLEMLEFAPVVRMPISLCMFSWLLQLRTPHLTTFKELMNTVIDSRNPLRRSIGSEICQLINLKTLVFSEITSLPAEIGLLSNLQSLKLFASDLTSLPREIGRLTSLTQLECTANYRLRELPNEIMDLSSDCAITLTRNGFTPAISNNIRNLTTSSGYRGPSFAITIREIDQQMRNDFSVEELLTELFNEINETYVAFKNIPGDDIDSRALQAWLARLHFMQDFNCGPERKMWMINIIIKYLKLADENRSYRQDFGAIITEAAESCGDRVAYYCILLDIAYQLTKIDIRDMKKLADFLTKGFWAISMLEKIAQDKIKILWFVDDIEVFLAYPVKLRERLNLPINIKDMIHHNLCGVREVDLEEAYQMVSRKLADKKAYLEFLATHDKWKQSLKVNYSREFAAIEKTRNDQSERAVTKKGYKVYNLIEATYIRSLIELTATALNEADGSTASSSG